MLRVRGWWWGILLLFEGELEDGRTDYMWRVAGKSGDEGRYVSDEH